MSGQERAISRAMTRASCKMDIFFPSVSMVNQRNLALCWIGSDTNSICTLRRLVRPREQNSPVRPERGRPCLPACSKFGCHERRIHARLLKLSNAPLTTGVEDGFLHWLNTSQSQSRGCKTGADQLAQKFQDPSLRSFLHRKIVAPAATMIAVFLGSELQSPEPQGS